MCFRLARFSLKLYSTYIKRCLVRSKMAEIFNWFRPGHKLVTDKFEWNVQVPFIQTNNMTYVRGPQSPVFSPQETPNSNWKLERDDNLTKIMIRTFRCNSAGNIVSFVEPALVKLSLLNRKGRKVCQQMLPSLQHSNFVDFFLWKEDLIQSGCQQADGSLIFCCKIRSHVKMESSVSLADPPSCVSINCLDELSTQLEELFDSKSSSDVHFNVCGRDFSAHKNILAARSKVFAAMFKHPTKENSTNQIENIEPEVFDQLLRFIYTGKVPLEKLETMVIGLFIAADKYLMDGLKMKCENYLLYHMSPDNCVVLLFHGDLQNPAEPLKEAAKFLRRFPSQVVATDGWKKIKKENPAVLCEIHEFVYQHK